MTIPPESHARLFDSSQLSEEQKQMLVDFQARRKHFDRIIAEQKLKLFTCPNCGYPTMLDQSDCICQLCNWQNDFQDDPEADKIMGGPNYSISLTESRLHIAAELKRADITPEETEKLSLDDVLERLCAHKRAWLNKRNLVKPY